MISQTDQLHFLLDCEFRSKQFHKDIPPSCFMEGNPREKCNSETCPLGDSILQKNLLKLSSQVENFIVKKDTLRSPVWKKTSVDFTHNLSLAETYSTRGEDPTPKNRTYNKTQL